MKKFLFFLLPLLLACSVNAKEFRGVWVATVENLDFPRCRTAEEFKRHCDRIFNNLAERNCNAVIFQVRPNADAFYPSRLVPMSRFLAGKEGRGLGNFDPLAYLIRSARRRGMEFHAWFNPYRVTGTVKMSKAACLGALAPGNFARLNPDLVLSIPLGKGQYSYMLDPGDPRVIRHIINVVAEVAQRYRPDAIHFDDYFYPYDGKNIPDSGTWKRYNPHKLELADWRRNNVDTLIYGVRTALNRINAKGGRPVQFGISPFGIWKNYSAACPAGSRTSGKESCTVLYADSRRWVKQRWIDYIVPQLYWHRTHPQASFSVLFNWWCDVVRHTGVKLYIGHALYRFGTPGWSADEVVQQLKMVRSRPEASGSVLFSCRHLIAPGNAAFRNGVRRIWKK